MNFINLSSVSWSKRITWQLLCRNVRPTVISTSSDLCDFTQISKLLTSKMVISPSSDEGKIMQNSSYFLVVYLYCPASLSTPVIVLLVKVGAVLQTRPVSATLYQTKALSSKLCITQYLTTFCTVIVV